MNRSGRGWWALTVIALVAYSGCLLIVRLHSRQSFWEDAAMVAVAEALAFTYIVGRVR